MAERLIRRQNINISLAKRTKQPREACFPGLFCNVRIDNHLQFDTIEKRMIQIRKALRSVGIWGGKMKTRNRIIECLLTAVLLLALAPCVLAEDAGDAYVLRLGAPEEQTVTDAASGNEYSYYRVPISVKNNTDTTAKVAFVSLHLRYDSNLRPADFVYWDKKSGEAVQFPFVSAALSGWDWAVPRNTMVCVPIWSPLVKLSAAVCPWVRIAGAGH